MMPRIPMMTPKSVEIASLKAENARLRAEAAALSSSGASSSGAPRSRGSRLNAYNQEALLQKLQKEFKQRSSGAGLHDMWIKFREHDTEEPWGVLNEREFVNAMMAYAGSGSSRRLQISRIEAVELFLIFDTNGSNQSGGGVNYIETIDHLCGKLTEERRKKVERAFDYLDPDGTGELSHKETFLRFEPELHPAVVKGKREAATVREEVLRTLALCEEQGDNRHQDRGDGRITRREWVRYFTGISNSIESERYFEMVLEAFLNAPEVDLNVAIPPPPKNRAKSHGRPPARPR